MMHDPTTNDTFTEFKFEGFKNRETVSCDSLLLLNHLIFLEWDSNVESYFQPLMSISADYQNTDYEANIDLWINYRSGITKLVHFLDSEWTSLMNIHPKLCDRFQDFCRSSNLQYVPVATSVGGCEPLISNLNLLWGNARQHKLRPAHILLVNNFFATEKETNVGSLRRALIKNGFPGELAFTMIFHKLVLADVLYFLLTDETSILPRYVYPDTESIQFALLGENND